MILIILATFEAVYLLYNSAYGLIFFSVAKANQTGVGANGQLELGATANKYNKGIAAKAAKELAN